VLPFVDMSEKKDQEYFADGLSEELIDHLAHSLDLKVIARTSSFQFKGRNEDLRTVASTLGVAHLVEGSVRKAGRKLRITAQLIRASDGMHIWSQTYERKLSDIFQIQNEIAENVSQALKVALDAKRSGVAKEMRNADAYNLVLQGDFFHRRSNKEDVKRAIDFYERALRIEPQSALAWAKLGNSYGHLAELESDWSGGSVRRCREAVNQALRIDPDLAFAHVVQAKTDVVFDFDWKSALAEMTLASKLDPSDDRILLLSDHFLVETQGMFDKAIADYRRILARDPLDASTWAFLGYVYLLANRMEESEEAYRKALQINPSAADLRGELSEALLFGERPIEALAIMDKESNESTRLSILPALYWKLGRRTESDSALELLERKYASEAAYQIAGLHSYRGETDAAFVWLERAFRQHDGGIHEIRFDPMLRNLRDDARYQTLLVKLRLSEYRHRDNSSQY
jgi:TolB-like protein/Flp pilus assembly protein TadD